MRSKKEIETALVEIQKKLQTINQSNTGEKELLVKNEKVEETSSNLFALIKYMIDENKRTTMLLKGISESMARLENGLHDTYYEEEAAVTDEGVARGAREIPISSLDAQIIKTVQVLDLACADDVKKAMNYKGRNAASMHLNKLYKMGLLDRHQLGRKVYYKYDAGKATETLIVSPPQ